ncbi:MAG: hypothetical protein ACRC0X_08225 [Brevinema sp.]
MKFIIIILMGIVACQNTILLFQEKVQGTYRLLSNPSQTFTIDNSGNMAGTPELQMFFFRGVSPNKAIYTKKVSGTKYYVPIRLDNNIIYSNNQQSSSRDVSFVNMTAFGEKIAENNFLK